MSLAAAAILAFALSQEVGDFTRSPTETIIDELDRPFVVRSVSGKVSWAGGGGDALLNVLIEIQGPGKHRKIRGATNDQDGRFRIRHVPQGVYRFKATLNGYQSVMGTIVVSKDAPKSNEVLIEMHYST